jgi:SAM-dependent methyltransferase
MKNRSSTGKEPNHELLYNPAHAPTTSIEQHNTEIMRNRDAWARKPRLRKIYKTFYSMIAAEMNTHASGGLVVELGSGMGNIKTVIPHCITTDIFPNPWLDRQENAYHLSFESGSVSTLILFDVWHHLRFPGSALKEFHRVLSPGGCLILFEPAISWFGLLVYGLLHHEPVALHAPVSWFAPDGFSPEKIDYYAAMGAATRMFWHGDMKRNGEAATILEDSWAVKKIRAVVSCAYFATGGFSGKQIGGAIGFKFLRAMDCLLSCMPRLFASRLLVALEKQK